MVDQAPGAGDEDVEAAAERRLLDHDRDAAERGLHVEPRVRGVGAEVLGDLDAELTCRHEDDRAQARLTALEAVEHGQAEGGGLPLPVSPSPMRFLPERARGIAFCWMSVGFS